MNHIITDAGVLKRSRIKPCSVRIVYSTTIGHVKSTIKDCFKPIN